MSIDLHLGDAREILAAMDPCSVHAVVTDNPYHLKFMQREWDADGPDAIAYDPEFWALCKRVLKPGGHLIAFGAPRTHHRIWCAIEDAGLQIRDTLEWLRGKGYPKNYDVSRGIDELLGAEREVVGYPDHPDGAPRRRDGSHVRPHAKQGGHGFGDRWSTPVTGPATTDAKMWADWGTALKPAQEEICLARRPLEGTIAHNVLTHGAGAINIGACRVGSSKDVPASPRRAPQKAAFGDLSQQSGETSGFDPTVGRWPPNVLLSHLPQCQVVGMREVATGTAVRRNVGHSAKHRASFPVEGSKDEKMTDDVGYGDKGSEVVELWSCAPGCVVAELDAQSGPTGQKSGHTGNEPSMVHSGRIYDSPRRRVASAPRDALGAASRFFPTFKYTSPASTSERDAGCEDFFWRKAPRNTWVRIERDEWETLGERERGRGNIHPTVKPVEVMRWLVRLVTPPGGVVLDPFLGSGSTALACLRDGFSCVGIEIDPDHYAIARARVRWATTEPVSEHGRDLPSAPKRAQTTLF